MRRSDLRLGRVAAGLAALLLAQGCAPSCERTCRKLLRCGNLESDRVSVQECEASCQSQISLYEGWQDERALDRAFDAHRTCLVRSTCDEIADGACYDERLYPVGLPVSDTGL